MLRPPAKVEVALAEVAVKYGAEMLEVAVKPEAVIVPPSKYAEPATASLAEGVVVPMPTFPTESTMNAVEVAPVPVEEEITNRGAVLPAAE